MDICAPLPGEHLWSVVSRSIKWSGLARDNAFLDKYGLNKFQLKPTEGNCIHLGHLTMYDEFKKLKLNGSAFPLWLLNFDHIETTEKELRSASLIQRRESQVKMDTAWRYCPLCAEEDRKKFGTAYWHTEHNLPFVTHCVRHMYPLRFVPGLNSFSQLKMPNRLKQKAEEKESYKYEFYHWSRFVVDVFNSLVSDSGTSIRFRKLVWDRLGDIPESLQEMKAYFNALLFELESKVPLNLLRHCFQFYELNRRVKSNILFTTFKRDGIQIRHPVYMLVILFWLQLEGTEVVFDRH